MLTFLVTLLIVLIVAGLLCWVITLLPIQHPWNRAAQALVVLIGLLYLVQRFLPGLRHF